MNREELRNKIAKIICTERYGSCSNPDFKECTGCWADSCLDTADRIINEVFLAKNNKRDNIKEQITEYAKTLSEVVQEKSDVFLATQMKMICDSTGAKPEDLRLYQQTDYQTVKLWVGLK